MDDKRIRLNNLLAQYHRYCNEDYPPKYAEEKREILKDLFAKISALHLEIVGEGN